MIITCEKCATRFRLDESLLKADGSKVRCSLCKHVFTAFPPIPDTGLDLETESPTAGDMTFDTPEDRQPESGEALPDPGDGEPEPGDTQTDEFEPDSLDFDDTDFEEDLQQAADIEISFEDEDNGFDLETETSFDAEDETQIDFDSDDLELEAIDPDDLQQMVDADEPDLLSGLEMDSASDILDEQMPGEISDLAEGQKEKPAPEQEPALEEIQATEKPEDADPSSEFDLTFDLDENKQNFDEQDLESLEKDDLDIQGLDMTDRLDPDGLEADIPSESRLDENGLEENGLAHDDARDHDKLEEHGLETDDLDALKGFDDDEFDDTDLDDIDLDDTDLDDTDLDDTDLDVSEPHTPSPDGPPLRRPARASLIQPLDPEVDAAKTTDPSSKKQPVLGTPVLVLLLIFLLAAGSYVTATILGYRIPFLPEIKIPFVQQHLSQKPPESLPAPDPVPDQKSVTGRFLTNDTAGELFIITGKIENPAQIPYRHIQVKGTLFQKEKTAAMTRIAYCGNIVPEDILKTGNIDDITAQLKTPRGAADINANVMPGDTVPFMLVFSDLPGNLENFTVEVAGFEKTTP